MRTTVKAGRRPLRDDRIMKFLPGLTNIEEIKQNTAFE
jgi:hypothetical protein